MIETHELNASMIEGGGLDSAKSPANDAEHLNHEICVTPQEHTTPDSHRGWGTLNHRSRVNDSARLFTNPLIQTDMELDSGVPLYKSFIGSAEIQIVARGVVAAAFFALATRQLQQWNMGSDNQTWVTQPLEFISRRIDDVISNPVTKIIEKFSDAKTAEHLMTFNKYVANQHTVKTVKEVLENGAQLMNKDVFGMSLGQAVVDVTWAFAAGSTGAALGRNMVLLADNNYKTSWLHNGKIDFGDMVKSTAKETFRILTYNEGEDWAVAIPYLIQRRLLNGALEKANIGNMWELQNHVGNSHMLQPDGTLGGSHEAIGFAKTGMEFSNYNVGTLVFRDLYNHIGHSLKDWQKDSFNIELKVSENPLQDATHAAAETAKYLTKSFIKAQLYMQPSMLAFSFANIGIGKANAALIDETTKEFVTTSPTYKFNPENMEQWNAPFKQGGLTPAHVGIAARVSQLEEGGTYFAGADVRNLDKIVDKDMYAHHSSPLSPVMNPIGKAANSYANGLYSHVTEPLFNKLGLDSSWRQISDNFARAQTAYLPYMFTKYTLAQQVDTPEADAAINRGLDGLTSGRIGEVWEGVKDVFNVITGAPVSQITQAKTFEPRGLINSTCDSKIRTEQSQQNLKVKEEQERHKDDAIPIIPMNKIISSAFTQSKAAAPQTQLNAIF